MKGTFYNAVNETHQASRNICFLRSASLLIGLISDTEDLQVLLWTFTAQKIIHGMLANDLHLLVPGKLFH